MSLRTRVLLSYVGIALIPILAITLVSWVQISGFVEAQLEASAEGTVRRVSRTLADELRRIDQVTLSVLSDVRVREILGRSDDQYPIADQLADYGYLRDIAVALQERNELIHRTRVVVPPGTIYSNQKQNILSTITDAERLLLGAAKGETSALGAVRQPSHKYFELPDLVPVDIISFGRRIPPLDGEGGDEGGIIVDVLADDVVALIREASVLDQVRFRLVAGGRELLVTDVGDLSESATMNRTDDLYRVRRQPVYRDLRLESAIPFNEIFRRTLRWRNDMLVLVGIVAVLCHVLAMVVTRSHTRRITDLSKTIQNVDSEFLPTIEVEGSDEVSELQAGFNRLSARLKTALQEKYELGITSREAHMRVLQAQINPHFLYNTLELLSGLANRAGAEQMERIVTALSDYYRFSLRDGRTVVTLAEELQHVERYVEIENERHGGGIQLVAVVDPDTRSLLLPRITLQPLVENAIVHGILEKTIPRGTIMLRAERARSVASLVVKDDGVGIPEQKLATILSHSPRDASRGFGIYNVEQRIQIVYGPEAKLSVASEPSKGTTVEVSIPV